MNLPLRAAVADRDVSEWRMPATGLADVSTATSKTALRRLYGELPTIDCQGHCHTSCGPIVMSPAEYRLIVRHRGGRAVPHAVPNAEGSVLLAPPPPAFDCPLLANGRCTVYALRPLLCRLWGVVETMRCPYGCRPSPRYLTDQEARELLRQTGLRGRA